MQMENIYPDAGELCTEYSWEWIYLHNWSNHCVDLSQLLYPKREWDIEWGLINNVKWKFVVSSERFYFYNDYYVCVCVWCACLVVKFCGQFGIVAFTQHHLYEWSRKKLHHLRSLNELPKAVEWCVVEDAKNNNNNKKK